MGVKVARLLKERDEKNLNRSWVNYGKIMENICNGGDESKNEGWMSIKCGSERENELSG